MSEPDYAKRAAWQSYFRARKVLAYNEGFKRPGQVTFVKVGRRRVAELEKEFPDFRDTFDKLEKERRNV